MPLFDTITLPAWAAYPRGKRGGTGEISVVVHGKRATKRQRAALAAVTARAKRMQPRLIDALLAASPTFRVWKRRPQTITRAGLERRIALGGIKITADHHHDIAYVAYHFTCDWDPSGLLVVTHGERVIAAGGYEVLEVPIRDPERSPPAARWPTRAQRVAVRVAAGRKAARNPASLPADLTECEIEVVLPAWAGFVIKPNEKPSNGQILVAFAGESGAGVGAAQQAAYRHVVGKTAAMQRRVLDAIVGALPGLAHGAPLPKQLDRAALENLVALCTVYIHATERGGAAYVGYQLHCAWDTEHGLGVLALRNQIVDVGQGRHRIPHTWSLGSGTRRPRELRGLQSEEPPRFELGNDGFAEGRRPTRDYARSNKHDTLTGTTRHQPIPRVMLERVEKGWRPRRPF